ncbi:Ubiquitin-conjugating enzyme E2 2 [Babesia sp. Xinjiang]|uniref:Ubiquitin-conjugating enzyme E2 2 n=1 Tax=Babesia sp. Xinjiang TaxID=462227 RepID=UPI000A250D52|nr:Ubiquitin-conjugating enzyme E2 2 [Babesia sp. Xinjiang]ORM41860.1 Ubiquitin-conjugating enzyme E2 2 [Babesia sp. Xinjiang]
MSYEARRRLLLDLRKLQQERPDSLCASPLNGDIFVWKAVILGPDNTEWEGGIFTLALKFTNEYPHRPPTVKFTTKIFHPNVYQDGSICLDILDKEWSPVFDVSAILTSIQSLLTDPNNQSPANKEAAILYTEYRSEYVRKVREATMMDNFNDIMHAAARGFKDIEQLLEAFFGFLSTQTDFFHTQLSQHDIQRLGLDPAVNSKGFKENHVRTLLAHIFEKNLEKYRQRHQPYLIQNASTMTKSQNWTQQTVEHAQKTQVTPQNNGNKITQHKVADSRTEQKGEAQEDKGNTQKYQDQQDKLPKVHGVDPEVMKSISTKFTIQDWNGGKTNLYSWTQTFTDVTVEIVALRNIAAHHVKLNINRDSMQLNLWGKNVIHGKFPYLINADESMWSIEDKCRLIISLEKTDERWWDALIEGHPKIDVTKIESVKRFDEFNAPQQREMIKLMKQHQERQTNNFNPQHEND